MAHKIGMFFYMGRCTLLRAAVSLYCGYLDQSLIVFSKTCFWICQFFNIGQKFSNLFLGGGVFPITAFASLKCRNALPSSLVSGPMPGLKVGLVANSPGE